jgi:hypothetical protein
VSGLWIIRNLVRKDLGLAEGVDEGGAPSARRTYGRIAFGGEGHSTDIAYVPTTMRVNWTPFLAFLRPPRRVAMFSMLNLIELWKLVTGSVRR